MPKMKSHSGAVKRLHTTGGGTLKRRRAGGNHLLEHKSTRRKRAKHGVSTLAKSDQTRARKLLGGS